MENGGKTRSTWLQAAGIFTVLLVWLVIRPSGEGLFAAPAAAIAHVSMAVFVLAFLLGERLRQLSRLTPVMVQAVAALLVLAVSPGSVSPILVIVVVAQFAFLYEFRRAATLTLIINAAMLLEMVYLWQLSPANAALSVLLYMTFQAFALLLANYARSAEKSHDRLRVVNAELLATRSLLVESARDRERLRLSRELHDVAGHTLTALKLNLRRLANASEGDVEDAARQSLELADGLLDDIRALVGNLRQTDGLAIDGAIRALVAPFDSPRFSVEMQGDPSVPDLDSAQVLIAVAREAITNVVRHSGAGHCRITLSGDGDCCRLQVHDDGRGMGGAPFGHGLRGMRERLEQLSGTLRVCDGDCGGTWLEARLGTVEPEC